MYKPTPLNQITNIYYVKDNLYPSVYRYVSMREAENLFNKHQLYFTQTSSWAKNATADSGDPQETAFENWWLNPDNLNLYITTLCDYKRLELRRYGIIDSMQLLSSTVAKHICKYMTLQNDSYSYCLAGVWDNPLMINEYHRKWNRNVILKYKDDFPFNLSIINAPSLALSTDALCADYFKMYYVNSIEDYIIKLSHATMNKSLGKQIFNNGFFIKHQSFSYESEIRLKLQISCPSILQEKCSMDHVFFNLRTAQSVDEIIERCHKMLEDVRKDFVNAQQLIKDLKYHDSGSNTDYLILSNIPNNIVDSVYVFDSISQQDMDKIIFWSQQYNFKILRIHG